MRSRARIGNHPLHPAMVALPVGAFFLALVADIAFVNDPRAVWGEMAFVALGVGLVTALLAAVLGFLDFTVLPKGSRVRGIALWHMGFNVAALALYAFSFYLRWTVAEPLFAPGGAALGLAFVALALLSAAGWLGGKMVFELRAGVVEPADLIAARKA